jgi:nucleoside-diphosphate-sugar epimerase
MSSVAVSGASGFVGRALLARLRAAGHAQVIGLTRQAPASPVEGVCYVTAPELLTDGSWPRPPGSIGTLVHAAARAHVLNDGAADPLAEYQRVNVEGTLKLARQAASAGVRRFVFISSIKVNGESTVPGRPFSARDPPAPLDPYAISKMEAEAGLREIAAASGMQTVVLRPPLVYGPGVKGNFAALMRWVARGLPLPLGAIGNRRSLVALDNLVDLLALCVVHPGAANRTFLVCDGEDLSTTDLLRRMGRALGTPARLAPVPEAWLRRVAALLGRSDVALRLCGSLQVDMATTREALGWTPPIGVDEGLHRAARSFRDQA